MANHNHQTIREVSLEQSSRKGHDRRSFLRNAGLGGGVLALGYAFLTGFLPRSLERKRVVVDVVAWYWHFMGMLWVYVFAVIALG